MQQKVDGTDATGSCQFDSIRWCLQTTFPGDYDTLTHADVRREVVAYLRANGDTPVPGGDGTFADALALMANGDEAIVSSVADRCDHLENRSAGPAAGSWYGDWWTLTAASLLYNCRILCFYKTRVSDGECDAALVPVNTMLTQHTCCGRSLRARDWLSPVRRAERA